MTSPAALAPLPRLLEVKRTLDGGEKRFECRVLSRSEDRVVVLFVATEAMQVQGVALPAGTVTFGHFWEGRPYNVYHWLRPGEGTAIGVYANLASDTRLDGDRLVWLDLIIDVLILPGREPAILDQDEIPADAPVDLRRRLAHAQKRFFDDLPGLLAELEAARTALWPVVAQQLALDAGTPPVKEQP
jgi:hypothetical protein